MTRIKRHPVLSKGDSWIDQFRILSCYWVHVFRLDKGLHGEPKLSPSKHSKRPQASLKKERKLGVRYSRPKHELMNKKVRKILTYLTAFLQVFSDPSPRHSPLARSSVDSNFQLVTRNDAGVSFIVLAREFLKCSDSWLPCPVCTKHQWCKSSHLNIHHSLFVFSILLVFLLFEDRCNGLALVRPGVNMRYTYVKKCCNTWCLETYLHIQSRFLTCDSWLEVKNFIVDWLQEWLCFHIFAHLTDV